MFSWSARRKLLYLLGGLLVLIFLLVLPTYFLTHRAPSCFDGLKNGNETGVDCGGSCQILCPADALDLIIRWQRAFKVKDGVWSAVAYVENPNRDSGIARMPYQFKLYDKNNLLIYERKGETFIPPKKSFAVFESGILTGGREPARTFFEFLGSPLWQRGMPPEALLALSERKIEGEKNAPRLTALLRNNNLYPVYAVEVVAIVYDSLGNAIASSRTVVESVDKGAAAPLVFTWPEPFSAEPGRVELIYRLTKI